MKTINTITLISIIAILSACKKPKTIEQTYWKAPIPESYEYTMIYITQVVFDEKINSNTDSEIATFYGNDCRGCCKFS
jgi:hypothetical protein